MYKMELTIKTLRKLCNNNTIFMTRHVIQRCYERGITKKDIVYALHHGEIIKQYADDKPYPSCLVLGRCQNEKWLHVVVSSNGEGLFFITAYYPNPEEWEDDLKTRREK